MSFHMQGTPKGVRQRLKPRPSSRSFLRTSYLNSLRDAEAKQKRIDRLAELHSTSRKTAAEAEAAVAALHRRRIVRWWLAAERLLARAGRALRRGR